MKTRIDQFIGTTPAGVMGVLNLTPDSFSDGGRYLRLESAVSHAERMMAEGADILDIGGESTAPGSRPIDAELELARIEKTVAALGTRFPLSIDTFRSTTAARGLELGAKIINDVSALRADPDLAAVVREHSALLVMMHAKDGPLPHATDEPRSYDDMIAEIGDFLAERVDHALAQGIPESDLVLDPGWGRFLSLDPEDSWDLLATFDRLVQRLDPIPLLVCTSRKGFLGVPMEERDPVSQLTSLMGVMRGGRLIRTHRPGMARQFLDAAGRMRLLERSTGSETA